MATKVMLVLIFIGFISICYQILAKNVGYELLKIDNEWFVNTIITDDNFNAPESAGYIWSEQYAFPENAAFEQEPVVTTATNTKSSNVNTGILGKLYGMLEKYSRDYFSFTDICERISLQFNNCVGYSLNIDAYGNNQLFLSDGHMTYEKAYMSIDDELRNISYFSEWLDSEGMNFVYVIIPSPVSPEEEMRVQSRGYQVYSNKMADELEQGLKEEDIKTLDLRDSMEKDNKSYTEYFFKYEHHMVPTGGLWAASKVSEYIDELEGTRADISVFDMNQYYVSSVEKTDGLMNDQLIIYEGAEPLQLFSPKFGTDLTKYIADYDLTLEGSFDEVMYAKWDLPTYNTWNHGIKAIKTYRNKMLCPEQQPKILLLTESYSDVISPFLACAYADIDEIDLRLFSGSLQKYIEDKKPDIVICMYSAYDLNAGGCEPLFEFR